MKINIFFKIILGILLLIIKSTYAQNPPVITATGNQIYCSGTAIKIVETVVITFDPLEPNTENVYIQISSGYVFGQDNLTLTGTHPNISSTWLPSEGKLILSSTSGKIPYADFEAAIKDVTYTNSDISPSGSRTFSISLGTGQLSYLASNKHFYEYVPNLGITWTAAKALAETRTYYGIKGYLATLTAADEAQLAGAQAPGAGWIGGSDEQTEGAWKWVTGPEGLANGGTGTPFWNGVANGSTTLPYNFAFWNANEPNQYQGIQEDYAHINFGVGIFGSWNDLPNAGSTGFYFPQGYVVEYGGMVPNDVDQIQISASTTITIPKITSTTLGTICGPGSLTLQATATNGTVNWYDLPIGGTLLHTGNSFTTPNLTTTTPYYVDASNGSCTRTEVIATIKAIPNVISTNPSSVCGSGTVTLGTTASVGIINWYTALTGGISIATGTSFTTPLLSNTTSYFVDATNDGCTTGSRTEIIATVYAIATITATNPGSNCGSGTVTLSASPSSGTVNWYTSLTGGTSIASGTSFTTPLLSSTTPYYVDATDNGCTTGSRTEIIATIKTIPTITTTNSGSRCGAGTVTLGATASAGSINWYTSLTGGTSIATGTSFTTPLLSSTTSYFVDATDNGCTTGSRTEIITTVYAVPTITATNPGSNCGSGTVTLSASSSSGNVNWYTSLTGGTSIATGTSFTTPSLSSTTPYYVDATNNGCTTGSRTEIIATIKTIPTITATNPGSNCGSGIVTLGATASAGIINWYNSLTGGTSIATGTTFTTPLLSITTPYFVEATDNGCTTGIRTEINAIINPLPIVNDVIIIQCDTDLLSDGKTLFNLTVNNPEISTNYTNENFTYYTSQNGAINGVLADLIPNELAFENTTPSSMDVWSRITDKITGCYSVAKLTLNVPAANINPNYKIPFSPVCDDFLDLNGNNNTNNNNRDGVTTFDFSSTQAIILAQLPINQVYNINYYKNESDALAELNVITDISNYRNIGYPNSQDIWIRIDSDLDNACYGLGPYLTLNVEALPNIDLNLNGDDDNLVCQNNPTFYIQLNAGIQDGTPTTNYTYIWSKDGTIIPDEISYTLDVNTEGLFTVKVENSLGCSSIRTIKVIASDVAKIDSIDVQDMTDINTITVNVSSSSLGDYEYSLDDRLGPFQDSNFFNNVSAGIHEVFVNDKNGCGPITQATIAVVGAPKFFTPNNDGHNDYWSVKGVNQTNNSKSIIYIFNRYGKLLKQWVPSFSDGWDGTFNGVPLPADDYWFTLKLEDGRETKGHFSLKR